MGPGQIPRENIVWLDSLLNAHRDDDRPVIFINHYPLDQGLNNWYEAIDRLKKRNIQLLLCGHGHANREMNLEGIPTLMGRSNLRARDSVGAYNIMHVFGDTLISASVRYPSVKTMKPWAGIKLTDHKFNISESDYPRPDFSINSVHPNVSEEWRIEEQSDIGSGLASLGDIIVSTGTDGFIKARSLGNGNLKWQYPGRGKIYGTPAISVDRVIISATDGNVYALSLDSGKLIWRFNAGERIVASPVINDDRVIITGSGGKCYSLSLSDGSITWSNNNIQGFVETIPLIYNDMVFFGTWDNRLYALDVLTGATLWEWQDGYANRMLSPAACVPAVANDRIFVVAPDRKMTSLEASTGKIVWQSKIGDSSVRESIGLSADSTLVFAKTMEGDIIGVSVSGNEPETRWKADTNIGYDIAPSVIMEYDGVVYVPTDKGFVYAFSRESGKLLWSHRISACLINQILPVNRHDVICTSTDGVITRLRYKP
jgi:outer membrane protein assembly factor BamB